MKNSLSERIAKNSSELAELRKKGERDYFEFDISKNSKQAFQRVADLQLALLKTDTKKHKYNVAIQVDDNRLEKKDRTTNEPVQFLVGRDQLRYEVVVNAVDKDRIRGYVSTPKDKNDRRASDRFPIEREVRYKILSKKHGEEVGNGMTVNMSSNGVLFTTDGFLIPGRRVELAISWPAQLNRTVPLKLVARGRVVRSESGMAAVEIQQYEFRTQGHAAQTGA